MIYCSTCAHKRDKKKHVDFYSTGNVHLQSGIGSHRRGEPIAFRNNTINAIMRGMTLESELFLFLFSHGCGAYNG